MELDNRFDLYFSYWLFFWALYSIISKETVFPIILMTIAFLIQYMYIYTHINKIINSKINYILFGNLTMVVIKYILIIYSLLFKLKNYNIYNEFVIGFILFAIFNLYYYITVKKIYYLFTINDKSSIPKIDSGPCVYWYKLLFNSTLFK